MNKILNFLKFNESRDLNDPILLALRAKIDSDKAQGAEWTRKKLTPEQIEIQKEELRKDKRAAAEKLRNINKIHRLEFKIKSLKYDLKNLMSEMENDPNVEGAGGKYADAYGNKMNKIEKEISKCQDQINLLNNPVEASAKLKKAREIGVFEK